MIDRRDFEEYQETNKSLSSALKQSVYSEMTVSADV